MVLSDIGNDPMQLLAAELYFDVWAEEVKNPNFRNDITGLLKLKQECLSCQLDTSQLPAIQRP